VGEHAGEFTSPVSRRVGRGAGGVGGLAGRDRGGDHPRNDGRPMVDDALRKAEQTEMGPPTEA
jgi:hypothetical protein